MEASPDTLETQEMLLNKGPRHPGTHGILRLLLTLEGEVIVGTALQVSEEAGP